MLAIQHTTEAHELLAPAGVAVVARLPAAPARGARVAAALRRLASEPFVHFLALGALIFAVGGTIQQWRNAERFRITLDKSALSTLAQRWEKQYGSPPSAEQLESLGESFVKEEILYREGMALHLDRDDEIIRRRVAQKLQFLQQDLAVAKDPTDEDLRAYYAGHAAQYVIPARVSFTHVYFSPDNGGDESAARRASAALETLKERSASRAPERGDPFAYQYDYSSLSKVDVARVFGDSPFSDALFSGPVNTWSGPIRSGYGWHLFYVSERTAPRAEPLAGIKERVTRDYLATVRERNNAGAFEELKRKYTIVGNAAAAGGARE